MVLCLVVNSGKFATRRYCLLIMEVNISAKVRASRSREQDGRAKQVLRKHTTIHF